ncbi:MAG: hypothetical protein ACPGRC_00195 [Salibacteraceae bacterium]
MNLFILSLITFLIPVGVLAIGLLDIYANRNSGISRTLFSAFLFSVLSFFLFNLMTEVEMGETQILGFVVLMPFSLLAGPLLLMYQKSLNGEKRKLLGVKGIIWNFVPSIYSVVILIVGISVFSIQEVNDILTTQKMNAGEREMIVARLILISAHVLWYIQLFWYNLKIGKIFKAQKKKFGKFYAQYEERNEKLLNRIVIILMMIAVYDLMFWIVRVRNPYLMIVVNIAFGVSLAFMIVSGREQIDIKRYRMYKLDSHMHELDLAHPPEGYKRKKRHKKTA